MSALDQAFIKAYAKDGPPSGAAGSLGGAVGVVGAAQPAGGQATRGTPRAQVAAVRSETIDRMYHDAVLYRVDAPRAGTTRRAIVPPPHMHLPPPTSPKRNVRRSMLQLLGQASERATPMAVEPPARPAPSVRQMPRRETVTRHEATPRRQAAPRRNTAPHRERTLAELADELAPLPIPPQSPVQRPTDPPVRRATRVELAPEIIIDVPRTKEPATPISPAEPKLPVQPLILPTPPPPPNVAPLNLAQEFDPQFEVRGHWERDLAAAPGSLVITPEPADLQLSEPAPLVELKLDALPERSADSRGTVDSQVVEVQEVAAPPIPSFRVDPPHAAAGKPHGKFPPAPESPIEAEAVAETVIEPAADGPQAKFGDAAEEVAEPAVATAPIAPPAPAPVELNFAEQEVAIELPPEPAKSASDVAAGPPAAECVPLWEVDELQWPTTVERLVSDKTGYFAHASGRLLAAVRDGLRTLAISGSRRGEGRTTLALALARAAAKAGIQVAVIDADFARPQLAARIGLEIHHGWQDAATGLVPLSETAIRSLADNVTVLPLEASAARTGLTLADPRVTATLRAAAATFELVIVDLGPLGISDELLFPAEEACPLDAAIVVRDLRYASAAESEDIGQRLVAAGIEAVGIAENFVIEEELPVTSV